jgi:uncharacterized membrane protein
MQMNRKAAITVNRSLDEVQRLWRSSEWRPEQIDGEAHVTFAVAPGDRGTEIHVELPSPGAGGKVGEVVETVVGAGPLAKAKDELRHFKQQVETGEITRSDSTPEGERVGRKLKQRPAQPLADHELEKAGA